MCNVQAGIIILFSAVFCITGYDFVVADDGAPCDTETTVGLCISVLKCPPAQASLKITRRHSLLRCGFEGLTELVCCPMPEENNTSTETVTDYPKTTVSPTPTPITPSTSKAEPRLPSIRRSTQACDEFSNESPFRVDVQILGGIDAKLGEFPHMAALGYESQESDSLQWNCGASLISNNFVITAAHCVVRSDNVLPIRIRLGKIDITGNSDLVEAQDFGIENITVHPEYTIRTKANDIAIIELSGPVKRTDNVRPACLYHKPDDPQGLVITGWGRTSFTGAVSRMLQKAIILPVTVKECSKQHQIGSGKPITQRQICAVSDDGTKDACQGDSGGPLQVQIKKTSSIYSIVGVTSFGKACGGTFPGVYTRIYSYLDWIEDTVWP